MLGTSSTTWWLSISRSLSSHCSSLQRRCKHQGRPTEWSLCRQSTWAASKWSHPISSRGRNTTNHWLHSKRKDWLTQCTWTCWRRTYFASISHWALAHLSWESQGISCKSCRLESLKFISHSLFLSKGARLCSSLWQDKMIWTHLCITVGSTSHSSRICFRCRIMLSNSKRTRMPQSRNLKFAFRQTPFCKRTRTKASMKQVRTLIKPWIYGKPSMSFWTLKKET